MPAQFRDEPYQLGELGLEPRRLKRAALGDEVTERFDERLVGRGRPLVRAPIQDDVALIVNLVREARGQAGLADPRLAREEDEAALPRLRLPPGLSERLELSRPSDKGAPVEGNQEWWDGRRAQSRRVA